MEPLSTCNREISLARRKSPTDASMSSSTKKTPCDGVGKECLSKRRTCAQKLSENLTYGAHPSKGPLVEEGDASNITKSHARTREA